MCTSLINITLLVLKQKYMHLLGSVLEGEHLPSHAVIFANMLAGVSGFSMYILVCQWLPSSSPVMCFPFWPHLSWVLALKSSVMQGPALTPSWVLTCSYQFHHLSCCNCCTALSENMTAGSCVRKIKASLSPTRLYLSRATGTLLLGKIPLLLTTPLRVSGSRKVSGNLSQV